MHPALAQIDGLLKARKLPQAEQAIARFIDQKSDAPEAYVALGKLKNMQGDYNSMLEASHKALQLSPNNLVAKFQNIEAMVHMGSISEALNDLAALKLKFAANPDVLQYIAEFYTHTGKFSEAYSCLSEAMELKHEDPQLAYNAGTAALAVGKLEEAQALFDMVIRLQPDDYDAYYNRSTLKKQTPQHNHIKEMEAILKRGIINRNGEVQIRYALAKEYEDIGEWNKSFNHLKAGSDMRSSMLSYNVFDDLHVMELISSCMNDAWCADAQAFSSQPGPIFILGMPRTGTTLVDRILNAHSQVTSLGEINDFVMAMMRGIGPVKSKQEAVRKSLTLNFEQLGEAYLQSTQQRGGSGVHLIDKTPANFLYLGLIAKAIPSAKIINLVRHPMDTCYAIYKALFRMGYPFSYDLESLGQYYLGYRKLMQHWHSVLPERIKSVQYEQLVEDTEIQAKEIVKFCGLEWQADCLNFHEDKAAVATASAAQVRQPVYKTSVQKWQRYADELMPLKRILEDGGLTF